MSDPQPAAVAVAVAPPSRLRPVEWIAIIIPLVGMLITFSTFVWQDGTRKAQIDNNTRRIEVLEAADKTRMEMLTQIDARTARIEGKLELLTIDRPK